VSCHKLCICAATMRDPFQDLTELVTFCDHATTGELGFAVHHNSIDNNLGVVGSYQQILDNVTQDGEIRWELLAFIHDDVICRERGWDERVLHEFEDPEVGLVGFGGARWHGVSELYKRPYELIQLVRGDYMSNTDDAEVHGARFTGSCDVAVLDGYVLIVRRDLLDRAGGWRGLASGCDFYCYDYALSAMARRLGYRIRLVGVRCHHLGGRTSVAAGALPATSPEAREAAHRWFYETYRDVMPARVRIDRG